MGWSLLEGDCVETMRGMDAGSVDAVVCDPPYGISFMGSEWDGVAIREAAARDRATRAQLGPHSATRPGRAEPRSSSAFGNEAVIAGPVRGGYDFQEWCEAWAREALRVLKPGGHLLAFGGTRTYHRLAAGVEDAGFEIRDTITWMYGSGFPKSLDVSKAVDRLDASAERDDRAKRSQAWLREHVTPREVNEATGTDMGHHLTTHPTQPFVPTAGMLDRLRPLLPPVPGWLEALVAEREVRSRNIAAREVVGERTGHTGPGFAGDRHRNGVPTSWQETVAHTDDARAWEGWGTALKPASEPVVVARKPLAGTVARNVLAHGTGGLNVEACRVGWGAEGDQSAERRAAGYSEAAKKALGGVVAEDGPSGFSGEVSGAEAASGRWPANVVMSHDEDCVRVGSRRVRGTPAVAEPALNSPDGLVYGFQFGAERSGRMGRSLADSDGMETVEVWACVPGCPVRALDDQAGDRPGMGRAVLRRGATTGASIGGDATYGTAAPQSVVAGYGDAGGPSRFFYTAKASRAERNAGLDGFAAKPILWSSGEQNPGSFQADGTDRSARNPHPTVKPIELMRWLVRLVAPPGGTVLDPFCGSGTTGCAAVLEGMSFVGVEREADYARIARARIGWWADNPEGVSVEDALRGDAERRRVADTGQGSLFA